VSRQKYFRSSHHGTNMVSPHLGHSGDYFGGGQYIVTFTVQPGGKLRVVLRGAKCSRNLLAPRPPFGVSITVPVREE